MSSHGPAVNQLCLFGGTPPWALSNSRGNLSLSLFPMKFLYQAPTIKLQPLAAFATVSDELCYITGQTIVILIKNKTVDPDKDT